MASVTLPREARLKNLAGIGEARLKNLAGIGEAYSKNLVGPREAYLKNLAGTGEAHLKNPVQMAAGNCSELPVLRAPPLLGLKELLQVPHHIRRVRHLGHGSRFIILALQLQHIGTELVIFCDSFRHLVVED